MATEITREQLEKINDSMNGIIESIANINAILKAKGIESNVESDNQLKEVEETVLSFEWIL